MALIEPMSKYMIDKYMVESMIEPTITKPPTDGGTAAQRRRPV